MKLLVTGSRDWTDRSTVEKAILGLDSIELLIHGGARGADRIAGEVARERAIPTLVFPADWEKNPRGAGLIRNLRMLDEVPDLVFAFRLGDTPGTRHCVGEARKRGIEVVEFWA